MIDNLFPSIESLNNGEVDIRIYNHPKNDNYQIFLYQTYVFVSKRNVSVIRHFVYTHKTVVKKFQPKKVNIFLPISFNICFGCSKELSH